MKGLTIQPPWANLIALGRKTIETRTHSRLHHLKGQRIAIHAGKTIARNAAAIVRGAGFFLHELLSLDEADEARANRGHILATAYVADARRLTAADSRAALCPAEGLFGLILTDVRTLAKPIPFRGMQGAWTVPADLEAQILAGVEQGISSLGCGPPERSGVRLPPPAPVSVVIPSPGERVE